MDAIPLLSRKNFIKTFALSLAYSSLPGRSWTTALASEIHPLGATPGILQVRLQDFPALQNESGSVRIAINPINGNQGPIGTFYPIIINRGPDATFFAVSSRCAHQGCVVEALDASSNQMNCFCHNSVYAIDGKRVSGPASGSLAKYIVSFDGTDFIDVKIPSLAYSLTVSSVQPVAPGQRRLQLAFRSFRNVDYEVEFRKTLDSAPITVPFALTETDPAEQMVYTARSATNTRFFVESDSPTGFYTVAIRVSEV